MKWPDGSTFTRYLHLLPPALRTAQIVHQMWKGRHSGGVTTRKGAYRARPISRKRRFRKGRGKRTFRKRSGIRYMKFPQMIPYKNVQQLFPKGLKCQVRLQGRFRIPGKPTPDGVDWAYIRYNDIFAPLGATPTAGFGWDSGGLGSASTQQPHLRDELVSHYLAYCVTGMKYRFHFNNLGTSETACPWVFVLVRSVTENEDGDLMSAIGITHLWEHKRAQKRLLQDHAAGHLDSNCILKGYCNVSKLAGEGGELDRRIGGVGSSPADLGYVMIGCATRDQTAVATNIIGEFYLTFYVIFFNQNAVARS